MQHFITSGFLSFALLSTAPAAFAQTSDEDVIVVTGSIRQGGAQDIKHFRGEADRGEIPRPDGMTSEGLMGEHDLFITSETPCAKTLCLNAKAMPASILEADYFAGLGFDSNISDDWDREPLNLVAVIDRSGSMGWGGSIENVKHSLLEITDKLRPGDQISMVLYGSDVVTHLDPLPITKASKSTLKDKIRTITIEGSTNMDAGLARGYEIAYKTLPEFDGQTRLMIFTDERPNTGRTDAEGFMARAEAASHAGIGLTTIGYGVDYGGELGAKIASVRGGNLFYVGSGNDVDRLFDKEFDFMVSELAHDLTVKVKPANGLKVERVYGVPEYFTSRAADGTVTMRVPTVFFSSQSGGLFVSLTGRAENGDGPLFTGELQYKDGESTGFQSLTASAADVPDPNLQKAEALSAQYAAMKSASEAYHGDNPENAFEIFRPFAEKFAETKIEGLEPEYELVATLNENFAIEAGRIDHLAEVPDYLKLQGAWKVTTARNLLDVKTGDVFAFSSDEVKHYTRRSGDEPHDVEDYRVNNDQIYLTDSDLTFNFSINKKGRLVLRHPDKQTVISLRPAPLPVSEG